MRSTVMIALGATTWLIESVAARGRKMRLPAWRATGRLSTLRLRSGGCAFAACAHVLDDERHHGQTDDGQDDERVMATDEGQIAEPEAEQDEAGHPGDAAGDVEAYEAAVAHAREAGHEGCERAHDGDEARENDGLAAVLCVEA